MTTLGVSVISHGASLTALATVALPALPAFLRSDGRDHECCCRVRPPPAEERVRAQPDEQGDREIGTDLVLCGFAHRRRRTELHPDAALGPREERHRRRGEGRKTDPDPAHVGMLTAEQCPRRLDQDVGDEDRVARGYELLRATFRLSRARTPRGKQPDDYESGQSFDQ